MSTHRQQPTDRRDRDPFRTLDRQLLNQSESCLGSTFSFANKLPRVSGSRSPSPAGEPYAVAWPAMTDHP